MKYLKLFESFGEIINKLSEEEYYQWFEYHDPIVPNESDLKKVRDAIKSKLNIPDFILNDKVKITKTPATDIVIYISKYSKPISETNSEVVLIDAAIFKFNDEWWIIAQFDSENELHRYLVDGFEGIEKFFSDYEIS